jgi:FeS assembly SUF system regulator
MLRVSKMADYGTVVMVYLAEQRVLRNVSDIALATHLAKPTVSKLVKRLAQAGQLKSERGSRGGYRLSVAAEAISVADIIAAIEGKTGLTECSLSSGNCTLEHVCHVREHWQLISQVVEQALQNVSLKNLLSSSLRNISIG